MEKRVAKAQPEIFSLDADGGVMTLRLRKGLYPLDAVYGAAYILIDRAYIVLDKNGTGDILVHVRQRADEDGAELEALAGEFANEALNQVLRAKVAKAHRSRLESIISQAMSGALGLAGSDDDLGLDDLDDEDDALDFLDDPLGIAVPWEEKFKKSANQERPDTRGDGDDPGSRVARGDGDGDEAGPGESGGFRPVKPEGPST